MKPKSIFTILAAFALTALALSGCVTYYKASDVRSYFKSGTGQASKASAAAQADYQDKSGIIADIRSSLANPQQEPYPEFDRSLAAMKASLESMQKQEAVLTASSEKTDSIIGKSKTIESDEKEYKAVLAEKSNFENHFEIFGQMTEDYQKKSEAFVNLAKKHEVLRVVTADIEHKVLDYKANSDKSIVNAKVQIDKAEAELNKAETAGYDHKVIQEKRNILAEMRTILPQITVMRDEVLSLAERFKAEAGVRKEYHIGPGMASHELLGAMKAKTDEINASTKKLNALAEEFNKKK